MRRSIIAFAALVAMAVTVAIPGARPLSAASPSDKDVVDAVRYRASYGFRADAAFVRQAEGDSSRFPRREFGVALSESEYAEIMRRSAIQEALDPAVEHAMTFDDLAGAYIDQLNGGVPVFMFVDDVPSRQANLLARLPTGTEIRVVDAERTASELRALKTRVIQAEKSLLAEGIWIVSSAIHDSSNTVLVGIVGLTEKKEARVRELLGDGLSFREDEPSFADSCVSGYADCFPLKGGIRVESEFDGGACSSGFVMKRDGNNQISLLTAGHCFAAHGDAVGVDWEHGTNDIDIGDASNHTWFENSAADAGFIRLFAQVPADKNQVLLTASPFVQVGISSIDTVQIEGESVCRNGITSGHDCGQIFDADARHLSCIPAPGGQDCVHIDPTVEVDFDSTDGDSGGPYQWLAKGYGIHVHSGRDDLSTSHGWYTTAKNATDVYFAEFGARYRFCLNDGCTVTYP